MLRYVPALLADSWMRVVPARERGRFVGLTATARFVVCVNGITRPLRLIASDSSEVTATKWSEETLLHVSSLVQSDKSTFQDNFDCTHVVTG